MFQLASRNSALQSTEQERRQITALFKMGLRLEEIAEVLVRATFTFIPHASLPLSSRKYPHR